MEQAQSDKLIIYQLLPRLFGNTDTSNKVYGSIEENGTGKFSDINGKVLKAIRKMGVTHIWYTGVIEHATMTNYSLFGIKADDPDVVKGRAGSPYAIKDYYDVDPGLAVNPGRRMSEFTELIRRTQINELGVIMDFIPNHVARAYGSDARPASVRDFGEDDDRTLSFAADNDFYYIPEHSFTVPYGYNAGGDDFHSPLKDGKFDEHPAKATGNTFSATPSADDWFETVKLNYGIDYVNGYTQYFDPVPPLWYKLYDILNFWAEMGVDGFRCDMVEMVPVEFWGWLIPELRKLFPALLFIGEAYQASRYEEYIHTGMFDYLYDKVGLYEAIRRLTRLEYEATTWEINRVWNYDTRGLDKHMLRFMENHDEERIASRNFAGDPWLAVPGMIVTCTLSTGPVMIYFGQEVGEPAAGIQGYSRDDGRTSLFDYCGVPEHQKWLNNGKCDGGKLSPGQRQLRQFYSTLLNAVRANEALHSGGFWELMLANEHQEGFDPLLYIFLRYTSCQQILVITNFNCTDRHIQVRLPSDLLEQLHLSGSMEFKDLLSETMLMTDNIASGIPVTIPARSGMLLRSNSTGF